MRDLFPSERNLDRAKEFGNNGETDGRVLVRIDHGDRLSKWGKVFLSAADAGSLEARGTLGRGVASHPPRDKQLARRTFWTWPRCRLDREARHHRTGLHAGLVDAWFEPSQSVTTPRPLLRRETRLGPCRPNPPGSRGPPSHVRELDHSMACSTDSSPILRGATWPSPRITTSRG
jgi:hypothetical protein